MNSCQSPMHAWYLKYDYFTINQEEFLECIEEIFKGVSIQIVFMNSEEIMESGNCNTSWVASVQLSSNSFDKRMQEFLIGILSYFMDFFKNELVCSESNEILEKCYNFLNLEKHYCQIFWKSSTNKPIPDFLRDRLFCSLFRVENMLLYLHKSKTLLENQVFSGVLKLLSEILKALLREIEDLRDAYFDYFQYLLRLFNLFRFFSLIEDFEELEFLLSDAFPLNLVKKLMLGILEKSRNKNSFKTISNSYHLLIEESLSEVRNKKNSDTDPEFDIKRISSRNHSNSFKNQNTSAEEFEALDRLNKRASKSIGITLSKLEKLTTSPLISTFSAEDEGVGKLKKSLTFKEDETENIPFLNQLANSYLSTQIMSTQSFNYKQNNFETPNSQDLSIIQSKMFLKSPNLPFNSKLGNHLSETSINESLGAKIVAGLKNKSKKNNTEDEEEKELPIRVNPSILSLQPSKQHILLKKKSEIADKLNQNLYTVLLSRDSNQIRDNILIAKNKKNGGKLTSNANMEHLDIDDVFEKRRKDRIIHSNRESSIKDEDFMTRSAKRIDEFQRNVEKTSLQSNDERKPPKDLEEKDSKTAKKINVVSVKEKDFIKINKMTEITEKLKASLFVEAHSPEPFDEEILEVSDESEYDVNDKFEEIFASRDFKTVFKMESQKIREEYSLIPGMKPAFCENKKRTNLISFFQPIFSLSARRRGMYDQISKNLILAKEDLMIEYREKCFYYKRNVGLNSTREAFIMDVSNIYG